MKSVLRPLKLKKRLVSILMYFSCLKPRDSVIAIFEINDEENLRKSTKTFTQMTNLMNLENLIDLFKASIHENFGGIWAI